MDRRPRIVTRIVTLLLCALIFTTGLATADGRAKAPRRDAVTCPKTSRKAAAGRRSKPAKVTACAAEATRKTAKTKKTSATKKTAKTQKTSVTKKTSTTKKTTGTGKTTTAPKQTPTSTGTSTGTSTPTGTPTQGTTTTTAPVTGGPLGAPPVATPTPAPGDTISWDGWNVLTDPIDPTEQTDVPWGSRSDWLQPWRAYFDTQPASMMRNALGINFNVPADEAQPAAQILGQAGFKRARLDIDWSAMSYSDPSQLADPSYWDTILTAMKDAGMRPLILLNANDGDPGPSTTFQGNVTAPVAAGATTVQVDAATAQQLVPGLSGFDVSGGPDAQYLVTAVNGTQVTLSQPLPVAVPAGQYNITTLRYQPFAAPFTDDGQPNPAFQQTLQGWLLYVAAVTSEVKQVLGNDDFDVEVWNELSSGSDFLNAANYYNPVPASLQGTGDVDEQLLEQTVDWIRNPANDLPDVGIGDGFANLDPTVSGATVPAGVTAIDRHPYYNGIVQMPGYAGSVSSEPNIDALGSPQSMINANGIWDATFAPTYTAFFPEYFLTAMSTNFLERDLSPITTDIDGVPHGRNTAPAGSSTPPQLWVTETGFRPTQAGNMTDDQAWHTQAKSALRTLASFVNKGVTNLDFYSADDGDWSMLDPDSTDGGPTIEAISRFMQAFAGPDQISDPRSLTLDAIADQNDETQFTGNGTAAYPSLTNLDVVAVLPFQVDSHKFVIPAYVMTRNLDQVYDNSSSTALDRFDLPPENYRIELGGLDTSNLQASATDPLTGDSVPVQIVAESGDKAVIQMPLTDSPRLLTLTD